MILSKRTRRYLVSATRVVGRDAFDYALCGVVYISRVHARDMLPVAIIRPALSPCISSKVHLRLILDVHSSLFWYGVHVVNTNQSSSNVSNAHMHSKLHVVFTSDIKYLSIAFKNQSL